MLEKAESETDDHLNNKSMASLTINNADFSGFRRYLFLF